MVVADCRLCTIDSTPTTQTCPVKAKAQGPKATFTISKEGLSSVNSRSRRCTPDASVRGDRALQSSVPPDRGSNDEHGYE
jgi:hypothetical protein